MSPARFERAAFRLGGGRSILLSYEDVKLDFYYSRFLVVWQGVFVKIGKSLEKRGVHRIFIYFSNRID